MRSKLFKNLIVDFKIYWFILTLESSDPFKRITKSFCICIYIAQEFCSNSRMQPATQETEWSVASVCRPYLSIG